MIRQPLTVCFPFVGDDLGGSHISALKLIQSLDPMRVRPLVVLHESSGVLASFLTEQDQEFMQAPSVKIPASPAGHAPKKDALTSALSFFCRTLPKLRDFIRLHQIDIVHTNDGRIHASWGMAARFAGAKLVWHHRGDPDALGVNYLAPVLAHHIITVSRFARPRHPILPIERKLSVVHSPFEHPSKPPDRAKARATLLDEIGCSPTTRLIGYFGALVDRKRPVAFVEAIYAFIQRHPDIPVAGLLFGVPAPGGPALDVTLRKRANELKISDRIHLMGFRYPSEPLMCGLDILLVPAVNEPFGRTLIEAMLLGTPVVATRHGGNPEAITDCETGFLVEPDKPEQFSAPMFHLLSDPVLWTKVSEAARTKALSKFGLEVHVDHISEIYENLTRRAGQPHTRADVTP